MVGSYPQSDWPIGLKRFGARFPFLHATMEELKDSDFASSSSLYQLHNGVNRFYSDNARDCLDGLYSSLEV